MAKHRSHSVEFKRQVVQELLAGETLPIFPNLAKDIIPCGPNQLWVSDITYGLPTRFIYVAIILDAWSRLIVGYAIGRSIDARLTVAALNSAIDRRRPPPGVVHHSDRGSQGRFNRSSQHLEQGCYDEAAQASFGSLYTKQTTFARPAASLAA